MTTDYRPARYDVQAGMTGRVQEAFDAHFWRDTFSASGLFSMIDMSGLWTARDAGSDLTRALGAGCQPNVTPALDRLNLWLLGYRAESAVANGGGKILLTATPGPGFQVVQLTVAGGTIAPGWAVDFADSSGRLIASMDGASLWSTPPRSR